MFKALKLPLKGTLLAAATASFFAGSDEANAYQIDCAILLCLAGGWPSAAECTAARAEFIRRITPWPVEPPLQIWRCPMGVSFSPTGEKSFRARLYDAAMKSTPKVSARPAVLREVEGIADRVIQANQADIDISGSEFNFVRSIRVFDVDWYQRVRSTSDGEECSTVRSRVRMGTYGTQGDFRWANVGPSAPQTPTASWLGFRTRSNGPCSHAGFFRGVGVEWRDHEGNHGYEVVRY
ncbi:hypothetical protein [uncultured Tateyamaria sp.]|uniref:hypothetical protein n=1 Tax=uncultured Tateyamaria sp. TaxID=455651 RepID=UPI0026220C49|nr:hypothetical protein [uncultured Tateyamaria sp.]